MKKASRIEPRGFLSRGGRIRTYDLHIPNVARYRATLHPELVLSNLRTCILSLFGIAKVELLL